MLGLFEFGTLRHVERTAIEVVPKQQNGRPDRAAILLNPC
jgi:hypothetical protein